jgi:GT2 family glycosyltransferase
MNKNFKARPIERNELTNAKVDIIIPFHGQYKLLHELCQSIWYNTRGIKYNLYLVDDCSPNKGYLNSYKKAPNVTLIQNTEQLGFGASLQKGFEAGKNEWVVFLHSDCKIESGNWLKELLKSYLNNPKAGIVSPKTNNPGIDSKYMQESKFKQTSDYILEEGYLPLYCALCKRDLFNNINGFIKNYPFRYYEDEELYYRLTSYGLQEIVSGSSWIHHQGSATVSSLLKLQETFLYNGPDYKSIIESNRVKCINDIRKISTPK